MNANNPQEFKIEKISKEISTPYIIYLPTSKKNN